MVNKGKALSTDTLSNDSCVRENGAVEYLSSGYHRHSGRDPR